MRERSPSTLKRPASGPAAHRPIVPFTGHEKRQVFKGMVVAELEAGILRYSRRAALMQYAAKLGIPEFEACLLIAEAQYHSSDIEPVCFDAEATLENIMRPDAWSIPMRLTFALVTAVFLGKYWSHLADETGEDENTDLM